MKIQNKNLVIVTLEEIVNGNTDSLLIDYCFPDKDNEELPIVAELFPDCDFIKVSGELGRGNICFDKHETNSTIYIIVDETLEQNEIDILVWWLEGAENEIEIDNTWNDWDRVKEGIAYRGGMGYSYNLYAKKLN